MSSVAMPTNLEGDTKNEGTRKGSSNKVKSRHKSSATVSPYPAIESENGQKGSLCPNPGAYETKYVVQRSGDVFFIVLDSREAIETVKFFNDCRSEIAGFTKSFRRGEAAEEGLFTIHSTNGDIKDVLKAIKMLVSSASPVERPPLANAQSYSIGSEKASTKHHFKMWKLEYGNEETKFDTNSYMFLKDSFFCPPFQMIYQFCSSLDKWRRGQGNNNYALLFLAACCPSTRLMIVCWMYWNHNGLLGDPSNNHKDVLKLFKEVSCDRYFGYFQSAFQGRTAPFRFGLDSIRIKGLALFEGAVTICIYVSDWESYISHVHQKDSSNKKIPQSEAVRSSNTPRYYKQMAEMKHPIGPNKDVNFNFKQFPSQIVLVEDVVISIRIEQYLHRISAAYYCFHTAFVGERRDHTLCLRLRDFDVEPGSKKWASEAFEVNVCMSHCTEKNEAPFPVDRAISGEKPPSTNMCKGSSLLLDPKDINTGKRRTFCAASSEKDAVSGACETTEQTHPVLPASTLDSSHSKQKPHSPQMKILPSNTMYQDAPLSPLLFPVPHSMGAPRPAFNSTTIRKQKVEAYPPNTVINPSESIHTTSTQISDAASVADGRRTEASTESHVPHEVGRDSSQSTLLKEDQYFELLLKEYPVRPESSETNKKILMHTTNRNEDNCYSKGYIPSERTGNTNVVERIHTSNGSVPFKTTGFINNKETNKHSKKTVDDGTVVSPICKKESVMVCSESLVAAASLPNNATGGNKNEQKARTMFPGLMESSEIDGSTAEESEAMNSPAVSTGSLIVGKAKGDMNSEQSSELDPLSHTEWKHLYVEVADKCPEKGPCIAHIFDQVDEGNVSVSATDKASLYSKDFFPHRDKGDATAEIDFGSSEQLKCRQPIKGKEFEDRSIKCSRTVVTTAESTEGEKVVCSEREKVHKKPIIGNSLGSSEHNVMSDSLPTKKCEDEQILQSESPIAITPVLQNTSEVYKPSVLSKANAVPLKKAASIKSVAKKLPPPKKVEAKHLSAKYAKAAASRPKADVLPLGRKLHWKVLSEGKILGTVFGNNHLVKDLALKELTNVARLNYIFSKPMENPQKKIVKKDLDANKIKIFPTTRAQNVAIVSNGLKPKSTQAYASILLKLDCHEIKLEEAEKLKALLPTDEEVKSFRLHLQNGSTGKDFREYEEIIIPFVNVPNVHARCRILCFALQFSESSSRIEKDLNLLQIAGNEAKQSKRLEALLAAALYFGNFVNHGVKNGDALHVHGFALSSLKALAEFKTATDTSMTALHFVVQTLINHQRELEMDALPSDLKRVVESMRISADEFKLFFSHAEQEYKFLQLQCNSKYDAESLERLQSIQTEISKRLIPLKDLYQSTQRSALELARYFGEDIGNINDYISCIFPVLWECTKLLEACFSQISLKPDRYLAPDDGTTADVLQSPPGRTAVAIEKWKSHRYGFNERQRNREGILKSVSALHYANDTLQHPTVVGNIRIANSMRPMGGQWEAKEGHRPNPHEYADTLRIEAPSVASLGLKIGADSTVSAVATPPYRYKPPNGLVQPSTKPKDSHLPPRSSRQNDEAAVCIALKLDSKESAGDTSADTLCDTHKFALGNGHDALESSAHTLHHGSQQPPLHTPKPTLSHKKVPLLRLMPRKKPPAVMPHKKPLYAAAEDNDGSLDV